MKAVSTESNRAIYRDKILIFIESIGRDAALTRQMSARVESLADAEALFDAEADQKALKVAGKLERAEAIFDEAMSAKEEAEEEAQLILDRAKIESAAMKQRVRAELSEQSKQLERRAEDLQSERSALEHEKRTVLRETVLLAASVTARVLLGVLTGNVCFDDR